METIEERLSARADYSSFLVHLTRRNQRLSAKHALAKFLREKKLRAKNAFNMFQQNLSSAEQKMFRVVCFTEAPVHQIKLFVGEIIGRQVELEPYGLVFDKHTVMRKGGNPNFYVNTYFGQRLANAFRNLLYSAQQSTHGIRKSPQRWIFPFVSMFGLKRSGYKYDFYWEREWKVVGDFRFRYKDVVVALCPEEDIAYFRRKFPRLRFISPLWGLDRILTELAGRM